eukprot:scpid93777/ scgid7085/ 
MPPSKGIEQPWTSYRAAPAQFSYAKSRLGGAPHSNGSGSRRPAVQVGPRPPQSPEVKGRTGCVAAATTCLFRSRGALLAMLVVNMLLLAIYASHRVVTPAASPSRATPALLRIKVPLPGFDHRGGDGNVSEGSSGTTTTTTTETTTTTTALPPPSLVTSVHSMTVAIASIAIAPTPVATKPVATPVAAAAATTT